LNQDPENQLGDADDKRNINQIHAAAFREPRLLEEGLEPGPRLLYIMIFATLCTGFFYIGRYLGEVSDRPHVLEEGMKTSGAATGPKLTLFEVGAKVYNNRCVSCHQQDGKGVSGNYPPLAASDYVLINDRRLIGILLHGLNGPLKVNGEIYNGNMPAWGESLSSEQIAGVTTFIRNSYGNKSDTIQVALVDEEKKRVTRTEPWTEQELNDAFKPQVATKK
jgi:mono/diheme cytochrome c family protein